MGYGFSLHTALRKERLSTEVRLTLAGLEFDRNILYSHSFSQVTFLDCPGHVVQAGGESP